MKKKITILISALLVLSLAIAAYSFTKSSTKSNDSASCCAKKDCCQDGKCKMGGECCKNHDSCQMHKKDSKELSAMHNHEGDAACCQDGKCSMNSDCCKDGVCKMGCCKDGKCEMHKKDGEHQATKGDSCKGKDSCPMKKDKTKDN